MEIELKKENGFWVDKGDFITKICYDKEVDVFIGLANVATYTNEIDTYPVFACVLTKLYIVPKDETVESIKVIVENNEELKSKLDGFIDNKNKILYIGGFGAKLKVVEHIGEHIHENFFKAV